jgi:AAA15 family ATPase/GTPase
MEHFIQNIEISNFKSFRDLKVDGFKRINLFIGKPNVGKSNFLEALGIFGLPFLADNDLENSKISDLIRLDNPLNIFFEGDIHTPAEICLERNYKKFKTEILFDKEYGGLNVYSELDLEPQYDYLISSTLNILIETLPEFLTDIKHGVEKGYFYSKFYIFKNISITDKNNLPFLNPPFGDNISYILQLYPELRNKVSNFFKEYGLKLVLDIGKNQVAIQKEKEDNTVFQIPFNLIADTLQRIIFYKTAVASNEKSVLIFEEPEAHAFPPYISEFTRDVINSTTNQFFIATHSPFILNDFLEDARDELAIFIVDFKDGQTVMKGLSRDEIEEVYKYGVDLFFNYESYLA